MAKLNQHNQSYYQHHGTTGVPDLLATAIPIQEALRQYIECTIPTNPIKVLELGFGSRPNRYTHILSHSTRQWEITLSDFSLKVLPPPSPNYHRHVLNLLTDPLPNGPFDVILSTYTFDSIDFPEDYYHQGKHYPGGLIKIAQDSAKVLTDKGIFLTIDKWGTASTLAEPAGGAFFKTLDLEAAAACLQSKGYDVLLVGLNEFLEAQHQAFPINLADHGCIVMKNLES